MDDELARAAVQQAAPHELRDYAVLADGMRGALMDPDGGMAWLCFPGWSDPAVFASLLGSGGTYRLSPPGRFVSGGYYEDGTLIWRRRWVTEDNVIECREALDYPGEDERCVILRRLEALDGDAVLVGALQLAHDYGRRRAGPWRREDDAWICAADGFHARWRGAGQTTVGSDASQLDLRVRLQPGEPHDLVLELQRKDFRKTPQPDTSELWQRTEEAWHRTVPSCEEVPAGRDVRRSFAVLRGMTTPSGGTVAAATTALPERAEAGRNYDYRYVWIRDTCYIGHAGAAVKGGEPILDDAVRWTCARVLADGRNAMPAYLPDGAPVPRPSSLGLPGYPGGSDTLGNRVRDQFQLDMFGEFLLLLANAASRDRLDADGWRAAEVAFDVIAERHGEKEAGIWEVDPDHWTHSRLICVAGLKAIAQHGAPRRWSTEAISLADHLLSKIDRTCLHRSGRWQRAPGDDRIDASLLLAEIRGALSPDDSRSIATRRAVAQDLCEDDYLYRYAHPGRQLGQDEGAFLICNFWMSLACLRAGEVRQGAQWFERTRASCGSAGLFSEEYDVAQHQLRGNLPQVFVHALLIECAAELGRA
jgi:GH15 family glucan-1,4-alpha-glucosidase